MNLHRLLSLSLMAAGAAAALLPLRRRWDWDEINRTVTLALDHDDVLEAAVRAGLPLEDLLHRFWHAGATHLTIPEDSLGRLLEQGRVGVFMPRQGVGETPPVGCWCYLSAQEPGLLNRLHAELAARLPHVAPRLLEEEGRPFLALAGDLPALWHVGLGFDPGTAASARAAGLQPLPRPTSYPWPTPETIERTLAHAAEVGGAQGPAEGPAIVAFQGTGAPGHVGELILGHEMWMQETIATLRRHRIAYAYFVESRHQRGDWFVAKGLAPAVVLAHEFTQPQLIAEDLHSAAHRWGLLAREKGIRLALLRMFKVVHATSPLENIDYVAAVADVLVNREGFVLNNRPEFRPSSVHHGHHHGHSHHPSHHDHHDHGHPHEEPAQLPAGQMPDRLAPLPTRNTQSLPPLPRDDQALPWISLVPAGTAALALSSFFRIPDRPASVIALAGLLVPWLVRRMDRPASELEEAFRPSYAPKLIALGTVTVAPLAASLAASHRGVTGWLEAITIQGAAALALAGATAEQDYMLGIETLRLGHLDWIVPLAGSLAAFSLPPEAPRSWRGMTALLLGGAGLALARSGLLPVDPLAALDTEHAAEHTHHLSRVQAALGDARLAISPRPLRKWTRATMALYGLAALGHDRLADFASVAATVGSIAFLSGFRQAPRPAKRTVLDRVPLPRAPMNSNQLPRN